MVMETPSPQCVGREFVRQYYTLLHEAPLHLHRFYSHNSSFVHGGVEKPGDEQPPVMGQADIHKKIMSLNFRDCHAKIRQVDSQATVGNAVVVQVTGELSNNGQPMRRFMQTFVLAPQSPKKYYVHNDIFRYQDEVFQDDSDLENQDEDSDVENEESAPSSVQDNVPDQNVAQYFEQPPTLSNGSVHLEDRIDSSSQKSIEEEKEEELEPEPSFDEKDVVDDLPPMEPETDLPEQEQQTVSEGKPFSWAALASKNAGTGPTQPPLQQSVISSVPFGKSGSLAQRSDPLKSESIPGSGNGPPQPQRGTRPRERIRDRDRLSASRDDGDLDSQSGRRGAMPSRFPDSHQLFVGNLPHNITEPELRNFFEKYGTVMELRINTKSSGGKLPNFGFVVFDNPNPVQDILSQKPIKFNGEHRLNVEEKKPRGEGRPGSGRGGGPIRGGIGVGRGGIGNPGRGSGMRGGGTGPRSDRGSMSGGRGGMGGPRR